MKELIQYVHQVQVDNGWWSKTDTWQLKLILVLSEMNEAFEAFRDSFYVEREHIKKAELLLQRNEGFREYFKKNVKSCFEDELADVAIRLMDLMGKNKIYIEKVKPLGSALKGKFHLDVIYFTKLIAPMFDQQKLVRSDYEILLGYVWGIAHAYQFDLMTHINLKMTYNATRGFRHGNKVV